MREPMISVEAIKGVSLRQREEDVVDILIEKQSKYLSLCKEDLLENKRKTGHWIWYVFPTSQKGRSESEPKTCVENENHARRLLHSPSYPQWKEILNMIVNMKLKDVFQAHDINRIRYFVSEWKTYDLNDIDMKYILTRLDYQLKIFGNGQSSTSSVDEFDNRVEKTITFHVDPSDYDCDRERGVAVLFISLFKDNNLHYSYIEDGHPHGSVVVKTKERLEDVQKALNGHNVSW